MDTSSQAKYHRHWLVLLVVVGLLLVFGILHMLYNSAGRGDAPIDQHPQQAVP